MCRDIETGGRTLRVDKANPIGKHSGRSQHDHTRMLSRRLNLIMRPYVGLSEALSGTALLTLSDSLASGITLPNSAAPI